MTNKPRIFTWTLPLPMLLIEAETGIIYHNQTRGVMCNQRETEGFLVPIDHANMEDFNAWHDTLCSGDLTSFAADMIDDWLADDPNTDWYCVDRQRLSDSEEGWVYVKPIDWNNTVHEWNGAEFGSAILIWENCD